MYSQIAQRLIPNSPSRGSAKLLRAWQLTGGVSAQVTALEIQPPDGAAQKFVIRRYGALDLANDPHIAAHEYQLLQILQSHGLAVPAPHFFDESGTILPSPYLVVSFIDGAPATAPADLNSLLDQMASYLSRVHRITPIGADLTFTKKYTPTNSAQIRHSVPNFSTIPCKKGASAPFSNLRSPARRVTPPLSCTVTFGRATSSPATKTSSPS